MRIGFLALAFVLLMPGARADDIVRIAVTSDYPPFNYLDDRGQLAGFDVDIATALCAAMRASCEFVRVESFVDLIPTLLAGRGDAAVASMSITEERKQRVAFTNHYYRTPMQFVGSAGFEWPETEEGLRGRRVAVESGTTAEDYVQNRLPGSVELLSFPTQDDSIQALVSGRVDLTLSDTLGMWHFVKSEAGKGFKFVGSPIYVDEGIGIALRKEDAKLLRQFNLALARIRVDGTYDRINARYFPFSIY